MYKINLLGIEFVSFESEEEFRKKVIEFINSKKCNVIYTPNAEMIATASKNLEFKNILKNSDINLPDGFGISLLAKKKGFFIKRFPGIEAMLEILELSEKLGKSVYFLGARKEVVKNMVENLKIKFPNLKIVGFRDGYFGQEEERKIVDEINDSGADILFVALGFPKQEFWIDKYKNLLKVKIAMGVGGSFDVFSGKKKRAPEIIRRLNLEWLYRILQDPKRIFERLPNLFRFLIIYLRYSIYEKDY